MRYRLNSPDVIHETVDGEALIIHTPSGMYFSVEGTGEHIWNALVAGHTADEISAAYPDGGDAAVTVVARFAQQLADEQLLTSGEQTAEPPALTPVAQPFSAPVLQKFTDMQELLLVDPIHEVDPQAGWPQRGDTS